MEPAKALIPVDDVAPRDAALMILGGLRAMDRLTKVISAEVMRSTIVIRDKKVFEELGFTRFADFLEQSPYSPMTKHEFYKREELYNNEGEPVFDLLNDVGVPVAVRKRLGAGNVLIDGDKVIVRDGEKETSIQLSDRAGLLEALSNLADANTQKSKKLEKGEKDFQRLKEKLADAEENAGSGKIVSALEKVHTVGVGGLTALATELAKASEAECDAYAAGHFPLLASQFTRINRILCEKLVLESIAELDLACDDEDRLASLLDD